MSVHNDVKGTGTNWSAFEEQLNMHTNGMTPLPIDNRDVSLQKYRPQTAHAMISRRFLSLQLPQFQVLNSALREQNDFSESQGLRLLQCASKLDQSAISQETQKSLIIWSKTFKDILGDVPFYLLFEPESLQEPDTVANIICAIQSLINLSDSYQSLHPSLVKFNKHEITLKQLIDELDKKKNELDAIRFPEKPIEDVRREFTSPGK